MVRSWGLWQSSLRKMVLNGGQKSTQLLKFSKKKNLTTAPVLALLDFTKEFMIKCDASDQGVGAILMQNCRPIAFFSKVLGLRNLSKSAYNSTSHSTLGFMCVRETLHSFQFPLTKRVWNTSTPLIMFLWESLCLRWYMAGSLWWMWSQSSYRERLK